MSGLTLTDLGVRPQGRPTVLEAVPAAWCPGPALVAAYDGGTAYRTLVAMLAWCAPSSMAREVFVLAGPAGDETERDHLVYLSELPVMAGDTLARILFPSGDATGSTTVRRRLTAHDMRRLHRAKVGLMAITKHGAQVPPLPSRGRLRASA